MVSVHHCKTISSEIWDDLINNSVKGTIFHTQNFLRYHKDRFSENEHHLVFKKGETVIALLPLAIFREKQGLVAKSPYGASWGGFVFTKTLSVKYINEVLMVFIEYLRVNNIKETIITLAPHCYDSIIDFTLDFSLMTNGFKLLNYELSHVVDLKTVQQDVFKLYDSKCRNQVRKGLQNFTISQFASVDEFYPILMEDKIRHNSIPTHSIEELRDLNLRFPKNVFFSVGTTTSGKKAAICYFASNNFCISTFYMCQENEALGLNGLNALVHDGIKYAVDNGYKYYDFGGSSVNGVIENYGVSQFKESFGAVGDLRRKYLLSL